MLCKLKVIVLAGAMALLGVGAIAAESEADHCPANNFELTVTMGPWTIVGEGGDPLYPDKPVVAQAMMYNGTVPGPVLEVTEGERVCVKVTNLMHHGTSVHFHGVNAPFISNFNDGVPAVNAGITIEPSSTYEYEWIAPPAGTFMYHSHVDPDHQIMLGLYGGIIVHPNHKKSKDKYAYDAIWFLSEWRVEDRDADPGNGRETTIPAMPMEGMHPNFFTINGKAFNPAAPEPHIVTLNKGEWARIRLIGIGQFVHPMHMHGRNFKVVARDGRRLPKRQRTIMNTISVHPGEIIDIEFKTRREPENEGLWLFHCHVLHHATNDHQSPGGLVSAIEILP
jgi:manganese oxidase